MSVDKLPRDWRVALVIVVGTLGAYFSVRAWVIGVAQASVSDAPPIRTMERKVDAMYLACVARGECKPPEVLP